MSTATATYEPTAGIHIDAACREAVALAGRHGRPVTFTFNGVDVVAGPGEDPEVVAGRWCDDSDRQAREYRNSPAGRAMAARMEDDRRDHQHRTDALIARLPGVVGDLRALVRWCVELSEAADHVGVEWSPSAVADAIETAGWRRDAHVGRAPAEFEGNPTMLGEYLVGQALACLLRGMPPHPVIDKFAREGGFLPRADRP